MLENSSRHPDSLVLRHPTYMSEFAIGISISVHILYIICTYILIHMFGVRRVCIPLSLLPLMKGLSEVTILVGVSVNVCVMVIYTSVYKVHIGGASVCVCLMGIVCTISMFTIYNVG